MEFLSENTTLRGIGRLRRGRRNLGCVGYSVQMASGPGAVVRFDPMPEAAHGDVFHLTLEDGRILECQARGGRAAYSVLDGPRVERRHRRRRPSPVTRAHL